MKHTEKCSGHNLRGRRCKNLAGRRNERHESRMPDLLSQTLVAPLAVPSLRLALRTSQMGVWLAELQCSSERFAGGGVATLRRAKQRHPTSSTHMFNGEYPNNTNFARLADNSVLFAAFGSIFLESQVLNHRLDLGRLLQLRCQCCREWDENIGRKQAAAATSSTEIATTIMLQTGRTTALSSPS